MPGFELIDKEEKNLNEIFSKSNGVFFAHGFENLRNNIFRVREFEKQIKKNSIQNNVKSYPLEQQQ